MDNPDMPVLGSMLECSIRVKLTNLEQVYRRCPWRVPGKGDLAQSCKS